jgi:23S rRNA (guanine745-N1)-methyltransferase
VTAPLACTVRDCGRPLAEQGRALACARGHSYDVARSGYVNLLQPQDRRSPAAGDAKEAVAARARLLEGGIGRAIVEAFVAQAAAVLGGQATVVDLGSGSGDALAALAGAAAIDGIGIDLSPAAADHAARRFPELTWVVANADRRLPLLDTSVSLVVSLHARRNAPECARVLKPGGHLLVAVPAEDDLIELRESVLGQRVERARDALLIAEHTPEFRLIERRSARERHHLDRGALLDLLRATYRGGRASAAARVATLDRLDVTLASDLFLFQS